MKNDYKELQAAHAELIKKNRKIEAELSIGKERYDLAVQAASVGIWDWDVQTNELYWSDRFKEIVGITDECFVPHYEEFASRLHPDDYDNTIAALQGHISDRTPYKLEYQLRHVDGHYIWIYACGQCLWHPKTGAPLRMVGSVESIDARKKAETNLKISLESTLKTNAMLDLKNQELENFAYIASHDLKAPLRSIESLANWVLEDCADILPAASKKHLHTLKSRINRMDHLLTSLLDYSRIGMRNTEKKVVDFQHLLKETVALVGLPEDVKIIIECNVPHIYGNELDLQRMFHNLLDNAFKYRALDRDLLIRIKCDARPENILCTIADNGKGIAPEFQDKIFDMFYRLQSQEKVEGSGMGLAFVNKIVQLNGGRITVNSVENKGTIFSLTWTYKGEKHA